MRKFPRYLLPFIENDLESKMIFLGGPRQVGKTTVALGLLNAENKEHPAYLNWDVLESQEIFKQQKLPANQHLVVFDEVHKYSRWRNILKGYVDRYSPKVHFLTTGSARLDHYRKGGDSLFGRYFHYRLHPFSLSEGKKNFTKDHTQHLLEYGGFPEVYQKADAIFAKKWRKERLAKIVTEDLRDLENVKDIHLVSLLAETIPTKVGAPLSIKNLREDLLVAHDTVERWMKILENLYICFRIPPYGAPKIRAVKKEQKLYLWDWTEVEDPGYRFENMVACQLLKYCHFLEDTQGEKMELRYLRDTDSREVDFVVVKNKKPQFAVEVKLNETNPSSHLAYFRKRIPIPEFYQVHLQDTDFGSEKKDSRIMPWWKFCEKMGMP